MSPASPTTVVPSPGEHTLPDATEESAMTERDRRARRAWFERRLAPLLDRLYGTALRLTRHPDDAEDIVAEAVARAWRNLDELRDSERFEAWLFHILTNVFISEWRRRRSHPQHTTEAEAPIPDELDGTDFTLFQQLHQPFLLWWGSLEEQFFNSLLEQDLQRALDGLPEPFRVVVVMVELRGHHYAEVAQLLDIPLGTVRSRLSRARGLLQKTLWEQARDAGILPPGAAARASGTKGESP